MFNLDSAIPLDQKILAEYAFTLDMHLIGVVFEEPRGQKYELFAPDLVHTDRS